MAKKILVALVGIFTGTLLSSPDFRLCGVFIMLFWLLILFVNLLIDNFRYVRWYHVAFAVSVLMGLLIF